MTHASVKVWFIFFSFLIFFSARILTWDTRRTIDLKLLLYKTKKIKRKSKINFWICIIHVPQYIIYYFITPNVNEFHLFQIAWEIGRQTFPFYMLSIEFSKIEMKIKQKQKRGKNKTKKKKNWQIKNDLMANVCSKMDKYHHVKKIDSCSLNHKIEISLSIHNFIVFFCLVFVCFICFTNEFPMLNQQRTEKKGH